MKENCQNILKNRERENAGEKKKNHRQYKDSPAFFLSECEIHLSVHLIFWERSPVLWSSRAIAFLLIFYKVHGGLIQPSDRKFYHTRLKKKKKKKTRKKN